LAAAQNQDELQAEIARSYEGLSKRLKVIADFVLKDPSGVALRTSATLANELGVAPSAIVRFAQAFGFSGFSEMQAVFKTQMQHETRSYRDRIRSLEQREAGRKTEEMVASFVDAGIASLQEMHRTTPVELIEQAAEMMASARMVHVLAQKRTFTAATYMAYNLARLEVPAHLLDGAGGTLDQQLGLVGPEDVVFAISFQPGSEETARGRARPRPGPPPPPPRRRAQHRDLRCAPCALRQRRRAVPDLGGVGRDVPLSQRNDLACADPRHSHGHSLLGT
jgi:DNA-binding MurR/RpiR family transcriptional regulator